MELTRDYFEKHLSEQLGEIHNRLDNITTTMATKDDIAAVRSEMATRDDLEAQTKELENYTDEVADTIKDAISSSIDKLSSRINAVQAVK